jgi:hypothetical protein
MRSLRIKWRIEAKIMLVRGSVILTEFFCLCFTPVIFFVAFGQKVRVLVTGLE